MPTAVQYADWMVEYCAKELGAPTDPMSLEKQLYYAQGFSLALRGEALFAEDFEAWTLGPVIPNVWQRYKGSDPISEKRKPLFTFIAPPQSITPALETRELLSEVVSFFSLLSAPELSRATHNEEPWKQARNGLGPRDYSTSAVQKALMRDFYSGLITDGEEALSRHALLSDLPSPRWGWLYVAGICARRIATHPFYFHGLSLWGQRADLSEPPKARAPIDRNLYKPLTAKESVEIDVFDSAEEFQASFN